MNQLHGGPITVIYSETLNFLQGKSVVWFPPLDEIFLQVSFALLMQDHYERDSVIMQHVRFKSRILNYSRVSLYHVCFLLP